MLARVVTVHPKYLFNPQGVDGSGGGNYSPCFELAPQCLLGTGKKGPVNTRSCDLEPLVRLFHLARSCVGILRYSTASLSWCSWYCYDNHIVIYNSLSGSGSLMRQLCCGWREFLVSGLGRFVCAPSSWDHSESGHGAWLQLTLSFHECSIGNEEFLI